MKTLLASILLFSSSLSISFANTSPWFEYELWIQAETFLEPAGSIDISGRLYNSGNVAIDLQYFAAGIAGLPGSTNTVCTLDCVFDSLQNYGTFLAAGDFIDFSWAMGTLDNQSYSSYGSNAVDVGLHLIPVDSDWSWGTLPAPFLSSAFVIDRPADISLPFNKAVINLNTMGQYLNTPTPLVSVPESPSIILLALGLLGLGFGRIKGAQS